MSASRFRLAARHHCLTDGSCLKRGWQHLGGPVWTRSDALSGGPL